MTLIVFNTFASFSFALYISHLSCRFIQKSSETPKNFASRKAVLGVTPRRLLIISLIYYIVLSYLLFGDLFMKVCLSVVSNNLQKTVFHMFWQKLRTRANRD